MILLLSQSHGLRLWCRDDVMMMSMWHHSADWWPHSMFGLWLPESAPKKFDLRYLMSVKCFSDLLKLQTAPLIRSHTPRPIGRLLFWILKTTRHVSFLAGLWLARCITTTEDKEKGASQTDTLTCCLLCVSVTNVCVCALKDTWESKLRAQKHLYIHESWWQVRHKLQIMSLC